ncbi:hypothetical protein PR048_026839 [Dryococelus australis]|uniref:Reverse transcriptase RNase H-like domain-containing protein n=1 Tax=Dryococelus australis TaxID=614101 RepID=A0ABQ9GMF2_9NEOP|nr:hypothetical protein PR048_026839 [Dryococelus australis]
MLLHCMCGIQDILTVGVTVLSVIVCVVVLVVVSYIDRWLPIMTAARVMQPLQEILITWWTGISQHHVLISPRNWKRMGTKCNCHCEKDWGDNTQCGHDLGDVRCGSGSPLLFWILAIKMAWCMHKGCLASRQCCQQHLTLEAARCCCCSGATLVHVLAAVVVSYIERWLPINRAAREAQLLQEIHITWWTAISHVRLCTTSQCNQQYSSSEGGVESGHGETLRVSDDLLCGCAGRGIPGNVPGSALVSETSTCFGYTFPCSGCAIPCVKKAAEHCSEVTRKSRGAGHYDNSSMFKNMAPYLRPAEHPARSRRSKMERERHENYTKAQPEQVAAHRPVFPQVGISPDLLQHTESTTTNTSPTTMIGHKRESPVGQTNRPVLPLNFHTCGLFMADCSTDGVAEDIPSTSSNICVRFVTERVSWVTSICPHRIDVVCRVVSVMKCSPDLCETNSLMQDSDHWTNLNARILSYFGALTETQQRLGIYEKKTLAFIFVLEKFALYIEHDECDMYTDNQTLNWILNNPQEFGKLGVWEVHRRLRAAKLQVVAKMDHGSVQDNYKLVDLVLHRNYVLADLGKDLTEKLIRIVLLGFSPPTPQLLFAFVPGARKATTLIVLSGFSSGYPPPPGDFIYIIIELVQPLEDTEEEITAGVSAVTQEIHMEIWNEKDKDSREYNVDMQDNVNGYADVDDQEIMKMKRTAREMENSKIEDYLRLNEKMKVMEKVKVKGDLEKTEVMKIMKMGRAKEMENSKIEDYLRLNEKMKVMEKVKAKGDLEKMEVMKIMKMRAKEMENSKIEDYLRLNEKMKVMEKVKVKGDLEKTEVMKIMKMGRAKEMENSKIVDYLRLNEKIKVMEKVKAKGDLEKMEVIKIMKMRAKEMENSKIEDYLRLNEKMKVMEKVKVKGDLEKMEVMNVQEDVYSQEHFRNREQKKSMGDVKVAEDVQKQGSVVEQHECKENNVMRAMEKWKEKENVKMQDHLKRVLVDEVPSAKLEKEEMDADSAGPGESSITTDNEAATVTHDKEEAPKKATTSTRQEKPELETVDVMQDRLLVKRMEEDGNSIFGAFSHQMYQTVPGFAGHTKHTRLLRRYTAKHLWDKRDEYWDLLKEGVLHHKNRKGAFDNALAVEYFRSFSYENRVVIVSLEYQNTGKPKIVLDDCVVYAEVGEWGGNLQADIDKIWLWTRKNKMKINVRKTKVVRFTRKKMISRDMYTHLETTVDKVNAYIKDLMNPGFPGGTAVIKGFADYYHVNVVVFIDQMGFTEIDSEHQDAKKTAMVLRTMVSDENGEVFYHFDSVVQVLPIEEESEEESEEEQS